MIRSATLFLALAILFLAACGGGSSDDSDVSGDARGDWTGTTDTTPRTSEDGRDTPEDPEHLLQSTQKRLLTRRGAHSYLWFPDMEHAVSQEGYLAGPALGWRQFTDLVSHVGVYRPVLNPISEFLAAEHCTLGMYGWYASHAVRHYACGSIQVIETTAYVDSATVAIRYRVLNEGDASAFAIRGKVADNDIAPTVTNDDGLPGFRMSLAAEMTNLWTESLPVTWHFAVASVPPATSREVTAESSGWSFNYAIDASETLDIVLTWSLGENQEMPFTPQDPAGLYGLVGAVETELQDWLAQAPAPERTGEPAYARAWYLFWENAITPIGNWAVEAITPSKRQYFRGVWLWDSAFHALALSAGGESAVNIARKQIDLFLSNQLPDGHIPREIWGHDVNPGTQPPGLLTWASLVVTDAAEALQEGSDEPTLITYLANDYPVYKANHEWFLANLDSDGDGLCEWSGTDSGWDTSPRWDDGPVEALDLMCWLYLDARLLGVMAQRLAKIEESNAWNSEADLLATTIQTQFWSETDGFFFDLEVESNSPRKVVTPATYLPLFVGAATEEQATRVAAHLADPAVFATPYLLPSVSVTSAEYKPDNYWRGPVWVVLNAFTIWGLERYALTAEAEALRDHTLALVGSGYTTYEYYDSQTGEGLGAPDFMWSAALYILLSGESPVLW